MCIHMYKCVLSKTESKQHIWLCDLIWFLPPTPKMSQRSLHNKDWPHSFEGLHSIPHLVASNFSSEKQCGSKHPLLSSLMGVFPGCILRSGIAGSNIMCILKIDRWCILITSNHNSTPDLRDQEYRVESKCSEFGNSLAVQWLGLGIFRPGFNPWSGN